MTAAANDSFDASSPVPVLPADTSPAAIRDALIDEEREAFVAAYQRAITDAATSLDLTRVLEVLRAYHRIAELTKWQGREAHRRMLDKAALIARTGGNPDGASADEMREVYRRFGR